MNDDSNALFDCTLGSDVCTRYRDLMVFCCVQLFLTESIQVSLKKQKTQLHCTELAASMLFVYCFFTSAIRCIDYAST